VQTSVPDRCLRRADIRWRMSQGEHELELGPGDYLAWDPAVPHDVENVGEEPGRMLVIYPRHARSSR
jgi:mannose-6-phosphate isomerase-like protein (cupin superfamily)